MTAAEPPKNNADVDGDSPSFAVQSWCLSGCPCIGSGPIAYVVSVANRFGWRGLLGRQLAVLAKLAQPNQDLPSCG